MSMHVNCTVSSHLSLLRSYRLLIEDSAVIGFFPSLSSFPPLSNLPPPPSLLCSSVLTLRDADLIVLPRLPIFHHTDLRTRRSRFINVERRRETKRHKAASALRGSPAIGDGCGIWVLANFNRCTRRNRPPRLLFFPGRVVKELYKTATNRITFVAVVSEIVDGCLGKCKTALYLLVFYSFANSYSPLSHTADLRISPEICYSLI